MTELKHPMDLNGSELVLWFDDLGSGNPQFSFLSNFHAGDLITLPGITWEALMAACGLEEKVHRVERTGPVQFLTGEHAFAAMKFWGTDWTHFRDIVEARETTYTERNRKTGKYEEHFLSAPNHAKSLGRSRQHPLRPDWEAVKLDVMAAILRVKFTPEREEGARLLKTGDALLVEGTYWFDEVWGVDLNTDSMPGRNWLGTLLMARRAELRALAAFGKTNPFVAHLAGSAGAYNAEASA